MGVCTNASPHASSITGESQGGGVGVCTNAPAPASLMGEGQETSAPEMVPAPPPRTTEGSPFPPSSNIYAGSPCGAQRTHYA